MEILSDKIIKFTNAFSPNGYIDLIEDVSSSCYPLNSVERRPHLTMELPFLFSKSDNISVKSPLPPFVLIKLVKKPE